MTHRLSRPAAFFSTASVILLATATAYAQSGATRPRRAIPNSEPRAEQPTPTPAARAGATAPQATAGAGDVRRAFELLKQNQFAAARDEAKKIAAAEPNNSEAWKIAGFAEFNLKQYAEAAGDLQRAYELQRAANEDDANTADALAQALVRTDQYEKALPLLVAATTRKGAQPDPVMLTYRGLAELRTGKREEAERTFSAVVKADPKNANALYYLGRLSYEAGNVDAAVNNLNRATLADPRAADAWSLLTVAYLRRAAAAAGTPKADADYLNAVRSSDALVRLKPADESAAALSAQSLIGAKQFARAAAVLERVAAGQNAQGSTLYLLGVAHSRVKNFPKAVAALERAAAKSPDANVYRELGYAYEVSRQYAKALAAYEKGAQLAPDDVSFKESAERVRPFAK